MKQSVYALLVGSAAAQPKYIYQGKDSLILDGLVPQPKLIAATFDTVCASTTLKTANTNLAAAIKVLDTKKGDTVGNLGALKKIVATKLTEKNTAVDKVTAADKTDRLTLLKADDGNLKVLNLLKAKYIAEHNYTANLETTNDNTLTRVVLDSGTNVNKDPITAATAAVFKGTLFKANETAQAALTAAAAVRGALTSETTNTTRYGSNNLNQTHLGKIDPALATVANTKNNYVAQYSVKTSVIGSLASTTNVDFSETALYARADTAVQGAWTAYAAAFTTRCELTDLNAAGAASVSISTEYGGAGTAVSTIKVTPATAVITLASAKKIIDVATMPSCCVQNGADATKCAVASTPYLGLLNKWEINQTTTGAVDSIGYGTGLKGILTIDPEFLTDANERTYRLADYKTQAGGSLTRLKDTAMEEYYVQKRISDRFWLKRIKVTLSAMGATFATTLAGNITTYKPMINDAATTYTMGNTTSAAEPGAVPAANTACDTNAGTCKSATALFTKLGLLQYETNVIGTPANMFENNAWAYSTLAINGAKQATKKLMDVIIYTKTTQNGVTAFTAGEQTSYADAFAYVKTFNALVPTTNDWRTLGNATFAKYKLYKVELTWNSGSKTTTYTSATGTGTAAQGAKVTTANDNTMSQLCNVVGTTGCADEPACLKECAKLPTAKYTISDVGVLSSPVTTSLDITLKDADNLALTGTAIKYCQGAQYDATGKVCQFWSKGIQQADATKTMTNFGKLYIRRTTDAVGFITKLKLSGKAATSDKWTPWYDTGMTAYLVKYAAFEEANFKWQLDQESYSEDLATYIKSTASSGIYERKTKAKNDAYHGGWNALNGLGTRGGPTIKLTENTSSVACTVTVGKATYPSGVGTCLDNAGTDSGKTTFSELAQNIYIPAVSVTFGANYGNAAKNISPMISMAESGNQGGTVYGNWKRVQDAVPKYRASWLDGMAMPGTYAMPSYGSSVPATGGANYVKKYALTNGYVNYVAAKAEYDAQSNMVLQLKADVTAAEAVWTAASNAASASVALGTAKVLNDATTLRTTATTGLKAVMDAQVKAYKDFYMATSAGVYGAAAAGTAYKATQAAGAGGQTAVQLAVTINGLRTTATGKWTALGLAEAEVTKYMETCFTTAGVAKPAGCVVGGYAAAVADVAAKTAIVKTEETKCKNTQWDAYKATLVSSMSTRKSNMTTIATLIDDEDVKRAAVKAGATGSRCEKPTSNGDPKSRGTKPCTTDTDCCGAATGKLADTGATALVSADSNMATMTIEVCQPKTDTKYKYRPPRMPMATAFPTTVEWDFKCIGDARRIAAMATFAAASLFMMQ